MAIPTAPRTLPDTYFGFVKIFPLTRIRDDAHLDEAVAMIDQVLRLNPDEGTQAYLDALTDLVESYEARHVPIPDASEADVLRELMTAHRLSQPKLAKAVGITQSTLSAVLNGKRSLTKEQVLKLAGFFHVKPGAFLPA